jgi:hypothetical protein
MTLSVRKRFEVFKRDDFTCRYCGRKSPDVILEVDHIVPRADGGSDDEMNLLTSCWECNSGKSDKPLSEVMTGEDPHDHAIALLERERQLREYNAVLAESRARREAQAWDLWQFWENDPRANQMAKRDLSWFINALQLCPAEIIRGFMDKAITIGYVDDLRWVKACVRNWRQDQEIARNA